MKGAKTFSGRWEKEEGALVGGGAADQRKRWMKSRKTVSRWGGSTTLGQIRLSVSGFYTSWGSGWRPPRTRSPDLVRTVHGHKYRAWGVAPVAKTSSRFDPIVQFISMVESLFDRARINPTVPHGIQSSKV